MPNRFCCCIPLRGGSLLIGTLIAAVSVLLVILTFTERNPMVMHLSVVHKILPWIAVVMYIVTGVVGLYCILAAASGKLGLMRFNKLLFWVIMVVLLTIWEAVEFILAVTHRSESREACLALNPEAGADDVSPSQNITVGNYTTTLLGMDFGNTYGLANCAQAEQAGVIALAVLLFVGQMTMFYFATVIGSYATKLRERNLGHRLRDVEWDDNIDGLAASYRQDARNAPRYPLKNMDKSGNRFTKGLKKFKFGK